LHTKSSTKRKINFVDVSDLEKLSPIEIELYDVSQIKELMKVDCEFFAFLRFTNSGEQGECYIHIVSEDGSQIAICISNSRKDRGKRLRTFGGINSVVNAAKKMGFKSIVLDLDSSIEATNTPNEYNLDNKNLII
jgi:hypothetical protein